MTFSAPFASKASVSSIFFGNPKALFSEKLNLQKTLCLLENC